MIRKRRVTLFSQTIEEVKQEAIWKHHLNHLSVVHFFIFYGFLLLFALTGVSAQQTEIAKPEIGFWVGAANPRPGSQSATVLNTTLGFGFFTRFQWPYIFYTEIGGGFANYLSQTERGLLTIPVYTSLCYKLPFELPVSIFLKAGGGAAYVIARPMNAGRWDPMSVIGTEVSFVAGRKVRIGLRVDFQTIYETFWVNKDPATQYTYTSPYDRDYRLSQPNQYQLKNGEFFNFALMVSFLL